MHKSDESDCVLISRLAVEHAPLRMVTARMAGEGSAGKSRWPMPLNWL